MPESESRKTPAWAWLVAALAIIAITIAIICLYLSMRDVMAVGGSCADGGPYQVRQHCPEGSTALILVGIFGGLIAMIPAAWAFYRISSKAVGILTIVWAALFGSLGYNFIYYAQNPPSNTSNTSGWWVCGILFIAMALPGLIYPFFAIRSVQSAKRLPLLALIVVSVVIGIPAGIAVADSLRHDQSEPAGQRYVPVPSAKIPVKGSPGSAAQQAATQLRRAQIQIRKARAELRQARGQN